MQKSKYKDGISVIVTVFNKEEYILQTLDSAVSQFKKSKNKCQIIVVDDSSQDDSYQLAKDFLFSRKVDYKILKKTNSGPSLATNAALKFVKYSYIKILDGDDILSPDSLDYMKNEMEKRYIDLLYGDWKWESNPYTFKFKNNSPKSTIMEDPFNRFVISGWGGASNLMIKSEVMDEIGGCDKKLFVQDFSIPLRVAGNHLKSKNANRFCIGRTNKLVCIGPKNVKERVMSVSGQTLYDLSLGTLNFLDECKLIEKRILNKSLKKIISRCWSWRKATNKIRIFDRVFLTYLKSKLNFGLNKEKVRYLVYKTWADDKEIRRIDFRDLRKLKILIYVGLDLLGDALIKLPFLICLKKTFPNAHITWLAGKGKSEFSKTLKPLSVGLIDKIIDEVDFGSKISDLFREPISGKYDFVIDTQKRVLTTLIVKRIKTKIFVSPCANYIFSDLKPSNHKIKNLSLQLLQLTQIFNHKKINYVIKKKFIKSNKIAICPGASVIWKRWSFDNFIEIANHLIKKKLLPVFILGPQEKHLERNLIREFKGKVSIFVSDDPMKTISISKKCKAGISNDTGCGHLIASSGIPTLSLFGPTDYKKFSPLGNEKNTSIASQKIYKSKNINAISSDLVLNKLKGLI